MDRTPESGTARDAVFRPALREDLRHWVDTDRRVALRAFNLIEAILREGRTPSLDAAVMSAPEQFVTR